MEFRARGCGRGSGGVCNPGQELDSSPTVSLDGECRPRVVSVRAPLHRRTAPRRWRIVTAEGWMNRFDSPRWAGEVSPLLSCRGGRAVGRGARGCDTAAGSVS